MKCTWLLIADRVADTDEGEALPADRDDGRRHVRDTEVGIALHARDLGISTIADPAAHYVTAIVRVVVVGQHFRDCVPVAGGEARSR